MHIASHSAKRDSRKKQQTNKNKLLWNKKTKQPLIIPPILSYLLPFPIFLSFFVILFFHQFLDQELFRCRLCTKF